MSTLGDSPHRVGRFALATRDGKTIHQHFGHATRFLVVDLLASGTITIEGWRDCDPSCTADGGSEDARALIAQKLNDCTAVLVARIGPGAAKDMKRRGVDVRERPGLIADVLTDVFMNWQEQKAQA